MSATDFVIVNLPPWGQDNPHIGIGYLAANLRKEGIALSVLDLNKRFFVDYPDFGMLWHVENKNFWSNEETFPLILEVFEEAITRAVKEVAAANPHSVGFSVVDPKERLTIEFIKRFKKEMPHVAIVLGGPSTSTPEQRSIFIEHAGKLIDAFVVGEGEEACVDIIRRINERKPLVDIAGAITQHNGAWLERPPQAIEPLEKLPFPTYEEFDMALYGKSLLVEWSRGCYSRCSFCKNWRIMPRYRAKSPEWVLEELMYHHRVHSIDEFTVVDSIMNGAPRQLYSICSLIKKNNLKISWSGQIAPRRDMDSAFFKHMKEAGCQKLQIGVESGSNSVLKNMRKTYTAEMAQQAVRNAKKAGIETEIFIIVGFPGESDREFKHTHAFIKRNKDFIDTIKSINTLHLIAGTEVFEKSLVAFNMKPLPLKEGGWHYRWETRDGNTYAIRKGRAQTLLDLASRLGIKVMETNICEGKEKNFDVITKTKNTAEQIQQLKNSIDFLQKLPQKKKIANKKRTLAQVCILFFVSFYTGFYIIYFWIFMKVTNKVLLGGRSEKK